MTTAARPSGDDEAQIRALVGKWMDASRAGDTAAVLDLIADDALFLVPGRAPFGKAAFAQAAQVPADVRVDGRSEIVELHVLGDWAYMISRLEVTMTPSGAQAVRRAGNTLTIFRREHGRWRLARDANLLAPAPEIGAGGA